MENKVTILVSSCDLYEDAWEPFFRLWNIQWPDCPYNAVLCTETKQYSCDFLNVKTVNTGKDVSWTARLRQALKQIDTEYVLFALEDFFLLEKVNVDLFNQAVKLLDDNPKIGRINFMWKRLNDKFKEVPGEACYFKPMAKNAKIRTNVLISLWRKEYFLQLLYMDEDPWQYENEAPIRSRYAGYEIYTQRYAVSAPIFHYCMNPADGLGITERKWLKDNKALFEKYGIFDVNFDALGFFEKQITYDEIREKRTKDFLDSLSGVQKARELAYNFIRDLKKKLKFKKKIKLKKHLKYWWYYKTYKD